jgi:hypothetical protein
VGRIEKASQKHHVIVLPDMARMIAVDNRIIRVGYGTIRKICIKRTSEIDPF